MNNINNNKPIWLYKDPMQNRVYEVQGIPQFKQIFELWTGKHPKYYVVRRFNEEHDFVWWSKAANKKEDVINFFEKYFNTDWSVALVLDFE